MPPTTRFWMTLFATWTFWTLTRSRLSSKLTMPRYAPDSTPLRAMVLEDRAALWPSIVKPSTVTFEAVMGRMLLSRGVLESSAVSTDSPEPREASLPLTPALAPRRVTDLSTLTFSAYLPAATLTV